MSQIKKSKTTVLTLILISILSISLLNCKSRKEVSATSVNFTESYLMSDMGMFSITSPIPSSPERKWYFTPYFNVIPNINIYSGLYPSRGELLAAHTIEGPNVSQGTVILIHGYDGSSLFTHFQYFAQQFVTRGFRVVLLDLPGHGFSGGLRGEIKDYAQYRDMINDFLTLTLEDLGKKVVLIGHSLGASSIYDAYIHFPEIMKNISASVLISPFTDLNNSGIYKAGSFLVNGVPAATIGPMRLSIIPSNWIKNQVEWSKGLEDYPMLNKDNMLLVFAGQDKVIKLDKSILFFTKKLSGVETTTYESQSHLLGNDGYQQFREETLAWVLKEIDYNK